MKVYFDYNLLGRLFEQRQHKPKHSKDQRWIPDYHALEKIYEDFKQGHLVLITCKEDSLEEFCAYAPNIIRSYSDIRPHLPEHMVAKFDLFDSLTRSATHRTMERLWFWLWSIWRRS